MHPVLERMKARRDEMVNFLEALVNTDSPSTEPELSTEASRLVGRWCEEAGAEVQYISRSGAGDHMKAVWGSSDCPEDHLLLLCHLDTVWAAGEAEERPFSVEGEVARGPGVHDMKSGTVQALFAIEEAISSDESPDRDIVLFCNTDEEVGSATSRDIIESLARDARAVLVLEPSVPPDGSLKTSRKGVGHFTIKTCGRAAHAGADHSAGVSAIEEMARQIQRLHSFTDYEAGTTVNVGQVSGGTRPNVVAAECTARVDVRACTQEEGQAIERRIASIEPLLEGAQVEVSGGFERPPMERTETIVQLFERARDLGEELGLEITEAGTGGASDGNFTAAMGVPTLDGLGAVGAGGHALDEWIRVDRMVERSALLVRLLQDL